MIKQSKNFLTTHSGKLSRKYAGKCIAVVDDEIVAVAKNRYDAYKKAIKGIPEDKEVGVYYIPTKKEILTAL